MLFDREDVRESGDIQDFHNLILNILQPERASFVLHPFLQCKEQAESGTADVGQFRTVEHYRLRFPLQDGSDLFFKIDGDSRIQLSGKIDDCFFPVFYCYLHNLFLF